jgi:Sec-independent protein translocase protein TatA
MLSLSECVLLLLLAIPLWHAKIPNAAFKAGATLNKLKSSKNLAKEGQETPKTQKEDFKETCQSAKKASSKKVIVAFEVPVASLPPSSVSK